MTNEVQGNWLQCEARQQRTGDGRGGWPIAVSESPFVWLAAGRIHVENRCPNLKGEVRSPHAGSRAASDVVPGVMVLEAGMPGRAYGDVRGCRFWMAKDDRQVAGMVGLLKDSSHVGRIAPFWIAPEYRETEFPRELICLPLRRGRDQGLPKIIWDADIPDQPDLSSFAVCSYQLSRRRELAGRQRLEFYLDLYARAECETKSLAT